MSNERRESKGAERNLGSNSFSSFSPLSSTVLDVRDYDLEATLDSGQVFRWQKHAGSWIGIIGKHQARLTQAGDRIHAETELPVEDWNWLDGFLQADVDLDAVLKTFPDEAPMRAATAACRGLRVLRQGPWECLASFILSSNKQIVHIRQIISLLCKRFGEPLELRQCRAGVTRARRVRRHEQFIRSAEAGRRGACPASKPEWIDPAFSFPAAQHIAAATEAELRACKMGFRAPHLLGAARLIADGKFDLERPRHLPLEEARAELMKLPGVGGKIADCVLLFAYGFDSAFPVDVWVERALRQLYFPDRHVTPKRLRHFAATHFGPYAGYAQQYLFHYMRTKLK